MSGQKKILEFLIFHRNGTCLCDLDSFDENNQVTVTNKVFTSSANKENEHRYKLIYGMLFSMKSFVKTLSPTKNQDSLKSFNTSNYKLHYIEFINGLRFIFISTPSNIDLGDELRNIHRLFLKMFLIVKKNKLKMKYFLKKFIIMFQNLIQFFKKINKVIFNFKLYL